MFIHPQPPHRHISVLCLRSHLSVGVFSSPQPWHCVCLLYECSSAVGVWSRWQLHYGLRAQGDSGAPEKERGGRRRGTGRVYCRAGPCQFSRQREGGVRRRGGQLLSPLMSTHFFHQLSIYRPVLHSVPSIHARKARRLKPSLQVIPSNKSIHSQTFQPPDLGRVWNTNSKIVVQIWLFKLFFKTPSEVCVWWRPEKRVASSQGH